jgi:hypothetical protein
MKKINLNECDVDILFNELGYVITKPILPSQIEFDLLYENFEVLTKSIESNFDIHRQLNNISDEWKALGDNATYYCNAPAKYVDRTSRADKENKIYYQANWDFINYFSTHHYELYESLPELFYIHNFFRQIHLITSKNFKGIIEELESRYPGITQRLIHPTRALPIVCKVLKYNPAPDTFTTYPHFDKGAFTMILNNNDTNKNKFVLCPYPVDGVVKVSDMAPPLLDVSEVDSKTHGIVIPDTTLKDVGYNINPTPHAVLPNQGVRFSAIAFLLVHSLGEVTKPMVKYEQDKPFDYYYGRCS